MLGAMCGIFSHRFDLRTCEHLTIPGALTHSYKFIAFLPKRQPPIVLRRSKRRRAERLGKGHARRSKAP